MDVISKGRCENQDATGFQQTGEFVQRVRGLGNMLKHFAAENGIEARIVCGYLRDISDQIDPRRALTLGLQTLVGVPPPCTVVLTKVL